MIALWFIVVVLLGYLIGSIPFGVIVGRLTRGIDVRDYGSGSMGMTNVIRTVGARAGALVFVADMAKGAAAVALAWLIFASDMVAWGQVAGGAAAVIGHSWPVYVRFRGGRGVTTGFGALLVMSWPVGLISFAVFLAVVGLFRYMSLGSMLAGLAMLVSMIPFVVFDLKPFEFEYLVFGLIIVPLILFRHRGNIRRLLAGTEPKIGQRTETR